MREFVTNIDEKEFDAFCESSDTNRYTKVTAYGKLRAIDGYHYATAGVKEDGKLVASALILYRKEFYILSNFAYVCYGYNIDYSNLELLHFFNQKLCDYCKNELHCCFLRVDPDYPIIEHKKNGELLEGGFDHRWMTEAFVEDGFVHLGYNYGYSGNWMSRFTYILDTTPDLKTIYKGIKNFNGHTRKNEMRCVKVEEGSRKDLPLLYEAEVDLAKKNRFIPRSVKYFERLMDVYGDNAHIYIAKADLTQAYYNVKAEYERLLAEDETKLKAQQQKERLASIASYEKELKAMEEEDYAHQGEKVLGAKLIVQIGKKVSNLNMYTFKILPNFRTAFALHSLVISECKKRGGESYDFEGVSGSLDPKDPYYGLQDFKRSFGGDFIEYAGEFDVVFNERKYKIFRYVYAHYRAYKRKFYLLWKGW